MSTPTLPRKREQRAGVWVTRDELRVVLRSLATVQRVLSEERPDEPDLPIVNRLLERAEDIEKYWNILATDGPEI